MGTVNVKTMTKQLNKCLQGIYMGIDLFSYLKIKTHDPQLKEQCEEILQLYEQHSLLMLNTIEQLGGKSKNDLTLTAKLSSTVYKKKLDKITSDIAIREEMRKSFTTGIEMTENFLSKHGKEIPSQNHHALLAFLEKNVQLQDEIFHSIS